MKQLFGLGAFKNAPIRKKLILSTWLVAIVPIVVIFAVVFFVFVNTGAESARRQAQLLLDKTVEEMDGYFNQAQESLAFMVTDMNMQTAIDNYVSGTYKEQLDLRDFLRNRLANVSTVGRRTAAISIYIKEADRTYSRDFSDQPLSGIYGGSPGLRIFWQERNPLRRQKGFPCRTRDRYGSWPPISSACATAGCWGWSIWSWTNRQWFSLFMNWPQGTGTPLYLRGT